MRVTLSVIGPTSPELLLTCIQASTAPLQRRRTQTAPSGTIKTSREYAYIVNAVIKRLTTMPTAPAALNTTRLPVKLAAESIKNVTKRKKNTADLARVVRRVPSHRMKVITNHTISCFKEIG